MNKIENFKKIDKIFNVAEEISSNDVQEFIEAKTNELDTAIKVLPDIPEKDIIKSDIIELHEVKSDFIEMKNILGETLRTAKSILNNVNNDISLNDNYDPEMVSAVSNLIKVITNNLKTLTDSYKTMIEIQQKIQGKITDINNSDVTIVQNVQNIQNNITIDDRYGKSTLDIIKQIKDKGD